MGQRENLDAWLQAAISEAAASGHWVTVNGRHLFIGGGRGVEGGLNRAFDKDRAGGVGHAVKAGLDTDLAKHGGFSYQPHSGDVPKTGYMLSVHPERERRVSGHQLACKDIADYVTNNWDLLMQPNNYLGGWQDGGTAYLDVSTHADTAAQADTMASQHGQLAYYDLAKGVSVDASTTTRVRAS